MDLDFVWVAVDDMERAVDFYNRFLETQPESTSDRMAYYDLGNLGFGLYNPDADGGDWTPTRGDNTVPAFRTDDLEEERERVTGFADLEKEYDAGDHEGFLFTDSEGNVLEVYSWKKSV